MKKRLELPVWARWGFPMACRIQQAGYQILGHDIVRKHLDGPIPLEFDPQKFARSCDLVLSVVRDEAQNLELCLGKQAIFKQDQRPEGLIIASTVSPGFILEMKNRLPQETLLVDAPMSGAPHSARNGSLTFMLGGRHRCSKIGIPCLPAWDLRSTIWANSEQA